MKILLPPALDAVGLPTPEAVTAAAKLRTTAEAMAATLRAAVAPDLETATAATADQLVTAAAEHEMLVPAKLRHALRLVDVAIRQSDQAWEDAAVEVRGKLADAFNKAAKTLTAEVAKYPQIDAAIIAYQRSNPLYGPLFAAADVLTTLARVRDGYSARTTDRLAGLHSAAFEDATRCLTFTQMRHALGLSAQIPAAVDVAHWVAAAQHPDISIHWNERSDQLAMFAKLAKSKE